MADSTSDDCTEEASILRLAFEAGIGLEVIVHGDESRETIARRVLQDRETISAKAVHLLKSFMRDSATFDLSSIEVFACVSSKEGDFSLQYSFTADRDPHEYGYTYFEVFFFCLEPPGELFHPFKFTIGFH